MLTSKIQLRDYFKVKNDPDIYICHAISTSGKTDSKEQIVKVFAYWAERTRPINTGKVFKLEDIEKVSKNINDLK